MEEDTTLYEGVTILITEGDTITSTKGLLFKDPFTEGQGQIVHRLKYRGKGGWEVRGEKREFTSMKKVDK